jgi:hypothetical protein
LRARVFAICLFVALFGTAFPLASSASADFNLSTQPALYPSFDPAVTDYVIRCTPGAPVAVTVSATAGTQANVDGQGLREGIFASTVSSSAGRAFRVVETTGTATATYFVRCLPADFPGWTFQRSGQPQAEFYAVAPFVRSDFLPLPPGVSPNYLALFDTNGVPVWWMKTGEVPTDFHPLSNNDVLVTHLFTGGIEEYALNGSLVRTLTAVGSGITNDGHEILLLPNGNYMLIVQRRVSGYNFCGLTNQEIVDFGFQEIRPDGSLVRQWFASDHIAMAELPEAWCSTILSTPSTGAYDVYHENSLEPDGNDVVISFRHLDAVYRVNGADGSIEWKLGGVAHPESLTVVNDPISTGADAFRGQHDARILADHTLTVHDNGFHPDAGRPPRAVRYAIDTNSRTATLVEQKNDPSSLPGPVCCGSARKLPGGDWVMSWGSYGLVTELSQSGSRVTSLTFDNNLFSYRADPVLPGTLSRTALRDGMEAQFPRGYARSRGASRTQVPLVPAYAQCASPDRTHGAPLSFGSCSSPRSMSSFLTAGTPGANGAGSNFMGFVSYRLVAGNPSPTANQADMRMRVWLIDVRRKADLSDYTGQLQVRGGIRVTDLDNGPLRNEAGTGLDTEIPATVPCTATASTTVGATCSLTTTMNAAVPGTVVEGKRATWQFGQVQVFDGGASGVAGAPDATLYATQGIFAP